jgi:hypothetical protein
MAVRSVKELTVYIKAYDLAMRIFRLTQRFPREEQYSLTSQIRRSSRSICLNLREAWAKRRYEHTSSASLPTPMAKTARPRPRSILLAIVATCPQKPIVN